MDPLAIYRFLNTIMDTPQVTGAILIDSSTGLSLGSAGKAREEDAPQLAVAARQACDRQGVGVVALREGTVLLRSGGKGVLVGVYKE